MTTEPVFDVIEDDLDRVTIERLVYPDYDVVPRADGGLDLVETPIECWVVRVDDELLGSHRGPVFSVLEFETFEEAAGVAANNLETLILEYRGGDDALSV